MDMDTRLDLRFQPPRRRVDARARSWVAPAQGAALVALIVAGVLVLVLEGHGVSWLAGLIAGAGAGAWIVLTRDRARSGARSPAAVRAERRTAGAVKPLERSGWRFVHAVPGPEGAYDHIAVGHGGLILLESLDPDGVVTMNAGELIVERREDPHSPPRYERLRPRALADATAVRETMQEISGRRLWVQAVVVFWSDFPAGCVTDGRCVYIHGSRLAEWMSRRPHQLDEAGADEVFASVQLLAQHTYDLALPVAV